MADRVESRRERRWNRPPPPRDWRWVVGNIGRILIATGLLMFGFVAYQLWGTGLQYAQAQNSLDDEFAELLASVSTSSTTVTTTVAPPLTTGSVPTTTTAPGTSVAPQTTIPPTPDIVEGDAIARIESPSIGLDAVVVAGVSTADLQRGPGHYPETPLPGQLGNSAIAGHRTTYGQPFYRIDELQAGDEIILTTVDGQFVYRVTGTQIVSPADSQVIATTDPTVATLTLTSCHPRYTARDRIIVSATLDPAGSDEPRAATPSYARPKPTAGTLPGDGRPPSTTSDRATADPTVDRPQATVVPTSAPATQGGGGPVGDAFEQGWFDDDDAFGQVALWGVALAAVSIGAYLLSRAVRRNWVGALVGVVPFVVCLYFFFENINRLLPAAL